MSAPVKEIDIAVLSILSGLRGVIDARSVRREDIPGIIQAEDNNQKRQVVELVNAGLRILLERRYLYVILKDTGFRPPSSSTLYLAEEADEKVLDSPAFVKYGDDVFKIVGEEIIDAEKTYEEKVMYFQKDFVLFPERRKASRHRPSFFLIPPIPFPELEALQDLIDKNSIVSVSPSTPADEYLRKTYSFSTSRDLATILIGCDGK